ncbi:hypothetical protein SEA_NODIGI_64 [Gordonia phage Nodigi]|nr:hypothetical protein SEA_NODIGI_64 [Gordonia phage Nodigi]
MCDNQNIVYRRSPLPDRGTLRRSRGECAHSHENCGCPILRVRAPARILAWMVRTPHNLLTRCALMPPYLLYIDDIAMSSPFWPFYSLCSSSAFGVEQSADVHLFERTSMDARFRAHQAGNEKERRNIWVGVSRVRR